MKNNSLQLACLALVSAQYHLKRFLRHHKGAEVVPHFPRSDVSGIAWNMEQAISVLRINIHWTEAQGAEFDQREKGEEPAQVTGKPAANRRPPRRLTARPAKRVTRQE